MNEALLKDFARAWSERDLETILSYMTEDCIYRPSLGSKSGTVYIGKEQVLHGITSMIIKDNAQKSEVYNINIYKDFGFWQWTYETASGPIHGCDRFEFKNGKIFIKDAYRKSDL